MSKNITDYPDFSHNPFFSELPNEIFRTRKIKLPSSAGMSVVNHDSGEVSPLKYSIKTDKLIDIRGYSKMFINNLGDWSALKQNEWKMMIFIMDRSDINEHFVHIDIIQARDFFGYKQLNMCYYALAGLIQKGFIARMKGQKNTYFINPKYFFKGDFAKVFEEYLAKLNYEHTSFKRIKDAAKSTGEEPEIDAGDFMPDAME